MRFVDWFLRTDIEYDSSDITIGSPMFWRAMQVVAVILLIMWGVTAACAGVSQDGAGTLRINTYSDDGRQYPHMVIGIVYVPGKGITYEKFYGYTDTTECSNTIVTKKAARKAQAYYVLHRVFVAVGGDYTVSMCVSICHPEWMVIYLNKNKLNASKEVYDKVMEALQ